jgi:hypothetical protein
MPDDVKAVIRALIGNPLSINQAYELAKKLPDYPQGLFDFVIGVV